MFGIAFWKNKLKKNYNFFHNQDFIREFLEKLV
jgi:hypothetical protein